MADAGPLAPKRNGACVTLTRAPCCGLPSPLASAIRVTVGARPASPPSEAAKSAALAKPRKRESV